MGLQLEYVWQFWQGVDIGPCGLVTLACGPPTLGRGLSVVDCPLSAGCCTVIPVTSGNSAMPTVRSQRLRSIIYSMPSKMPRISQVQNFLLIYSLQTTSTRLAFWEIFVISFALKPQVLSTRRGTLAAISDSSESFVLIHASNLRADVSSGWSILYWPPLRKFRSSEATNE